MKKNWYRITIIVWAIFVAFMVFVQMRAGAAENPVQNPAPVVAEERVGRIEGSITPRGEKPVERVISQEEEVLAKLVWGEARGCSKTEQAAVVWCVLNRVDDGQGSIVEVATAPNQFIGYVPDNPLEPELVELVRDVITRRNLEDTNSGEVGRVLPKEYLFFTGDGLHNTFTTEFGGGEAWDWSLPSPYAEDSDV